MATEGRWPNLKNGRPAYFCSSLSGKISPNPNLPKREKIYTQTALSSVAKIANFHRRALTAKRKKKWELFKKAQNPPPVLTSDNCKIAKSIVIWWAPGTRQNWKF